MVFQDIEKIPKPPKGYLLRKRINWPSIILGDDCRLGEGGEYMSLVRSESLSSRIRVDPIVRSLQWRLGAKAAHRTLHRVRKDVGDSRVGSDRVTQIWKDSSQNFCKPINLKANTLISISECAEACRFNLRTKWSRRVDSMRRLCFCKISKF